MEKPRLAPYILLALAFVGIADTLYLSMEVFHNVTPGCLLLNGCDVVLNSPYSKPFGVPFAYIGLVYYAYMLGLSLLLAIDPNSKGLRFGTLIYTGIGLLCSIGFELFQYFVIQALCMYCAISALTTVLLFGAAFWHFRSRHTAESAAQY
jgi:uncharacterized membrane protein